eukprot:GEMP01035663.1.p1 GENE.GEMP01035663.1~~GEMP01035663.1.p1  ORF type:complete len:435 (+),score=119.34 GEMP01035663.1:157-1461(+)
MDPVIDDIVAPAMEEDEEDLFGGIFVDENEDLMSAGNKTPGGMSVTRNPGSAVGADDIANVLTPGLAREVRDKENMQTSQTPGAIRTKSQEVYNSCLIKMMDDRRNAEAEAQAAKEAAAAAPEVAQPLGRELNDFERALIRLKGPKRAKDRMPDASANREALKLVQEMKEAQDTDVQALKKGQFACCKITMLKSLVRQVSRVNMAEHFVCFGGVDGIADWLCPIDAPDVPKDRRRPPPQIVTGLLQILVNMAITIDVVKSSKIGIVIKNILHDKKNHLDDRRMAEGLIHKWLRLITNPEPVNDDDLADMDEPAKKKAKAQNVYAEEYDTALLKPRRDKHFWDASEEQLREWDEQNRERRHAVPPMEKPVFSKEVLPCVEVKTKYGWNKTDPCTIRGKVDRRVQRMANPNKKAWKSAVAKTVSVEGRGLNLSFQN